MTKHVTLAEFQAHAAELLTEVQETGEAVVITEDGRPVAGRGRRLRPSKVSMARPRAM